MPARDDVPILLHYRVRNDLRELIVCRELKPGDRVSSERERCEEYEVSSITVSRAVLDLVRAELPYRLPGKGTFVSQPRVERNLSHVTSFAEDMLHHGLRPSSTVLDARIVPATSPLGG